MYYKYWGMKKPPFDNVPDPTLYWQNNNSLENAISEILFTINEGNDCLAVMVGDIGTGKTLGLRVILNELDQKKYRIAFITNPDLSQAQLIREIIGQLKNKKIDTHYKDELMEEFNTILLECANQGQKVVIFIDEANVMTTSKLHNFRLLTNLQDDRQNMVIFVMAGQKELAKRLESSALENLYQRIGVYCRIKGLEGPEAVREYISHRIKLCGGSPEIFDREACDAIWSYSNHGVARLINKIAKLCLKTGETNHIKHIDAKLVHSIATMFERGKSVKEKSCVVEKLQEDILPKEIQKPLLSVKEPSMPVLPSQFDIDQEEMLNFIQKLPCHLRDKLCMMNDKQLISIAGKMAIQHIEQQIDPKEAITFEDPVVLWDIVKGRIFNALKSLQQPKGIGAYA